MKKCYILFLFIFITLSISPINTFAFDFFTINISTDTLCRLDSNTGQVTIIGEIGNDISYADLINFNGKLLVLSANFTQQLVELLELDPNTGNTLSSVAVKLDNTLIPSAEGIVPYSDKILLSFSLEHDSTAESIGYLSLDGHISNVINFENADFDGFAIDYNTNQIYSIDVTPSNPTRIFKLNLANKSVIEIINIPYDSYKGTDIELIDSFLFSVDHYENKLHKIDINNPNDIETINIEHSTNDIFHGIVRAFNNCEIKDSDNDGVIDQMDKCPNTQLSSFVDKNGCSPDGIFINKQQANQIVNCMKTIQVILDEIGIEDAIQALEISAGVTK